MKSFRKKPSTAICLQSYKKHFHELCISTKKSKQTRNHYQELPCLLSQEKISSLCPVWRTVDLEHSYLTKCGQNAECLVLLLFLTVGTHRKGWMLSPDKWRGIPNPKPRGKSSSRTHQAVRAELLLGKQRGKRSWQWEAEPSWECSAHEEEEGEAEPGSTELQMAERWALGFREGPHFFSLFHNSSAAGRDMSSK